MSADEEVDTSLLDWRTLSLTQRAELQEAVVRRAHRLRFEMAAAVASAVSRALVHAGRSLVDSICRMNKFYVERVAISNLRKLDDAALRDIGIRRAEIESIIHGQGIDDTRRQRAPDVPAARGCDRSIAA